MGACTIMCSNLCILSLSFRQLLHFKCSCAAAARTHSTNGDKILELEGARGGESRVRTQVIFLGTTKSQLMAALAVFSVTLIRLQDVART
jgi:hypothetical protein